MYDKAIKVVYKAFSNIEGRPEKPVASFTFKCPVEFENLSDYQICEKVFARNTDSQVVHAAPLQ